MFSSTTLVKQHERTHKTNDGTVDKLTCPKCSKSFERGGRTFGNHIDKCRGILTEKRRSFKFSCFECSKIFYSKVTCAEHMASVHNVHIANIEKFCFECKTEVENPIRHAMKHNNDFECSLCGICLSTKEKMEKHMERHKCTEKRPFTCDICFLAFSCMNHVQTHKLSLHVPPEERSLACTACPKRFSFKHQLKAHFSQAHLEEKRFACPFCNKKFRQRSGMKTHSRLMHGEENTYLCTDCPEKYKILNDLKKHRQDCH